MAPSAKKTARKPPRAKSARKQPVRARAARAAGAARKSAPKPARRAGKSIRVRAVKRGAVPRRAAKVSRPRKAASARKPAPARRAAAPRHAPARHVPSRHTPPRPVSAVPRKSTQVAQAPTVPGEPELRITDEAVGKATGRDWTQWGDALDAVGAQTMAHSDIARLVMERFRLGPWWSQMVTVGYEQLRGLRVKHQKSEGFEISASKTLSASPERVYAAWNQDAERTRWLGQNLRVRGATPIKTIRLAGSDGISTIVVALYPKGAEKTQVTVQHMKLKDAAEAGRMKLHWAAALDRLRTAVEAP